MASTKNGLLERIGLAADRDLSFLHGFEQCALHFGGGAIDLIGKDQVGEDRAFVSLELSALGVEYQRSDQVGRKQVGSELDAPE